jgi:hypothetical protein
MELEMEQGTQNSNEFPPYPGQNPGDFKAGGDRNRGVESILRIYNLYNIFSRSLPLFK